MSTPPHSKMALWVLRPFSRSGFGSDANALFSFDSGPEPRRVDHFSVAPRGGSDLVRKRAGRHVICARKDPIARPALEGCQA